MNEFKVLSKKSVNFTDDRGRPVIGTQLYLIGQTHEPGWEDGWEVLKAWLSSDSPLVDIVAVLQHDDQVLIDFSRRGKVIDVRLV